MSCSRRLESMDQRAESSKSHASVLPAAALFVVGLIMLALVVVECQVLPWLEGSVETALEPYGAWRWGHDLGLNSTPLAPSLTIAAGLALLAALSICYVLALRIVGALGDG